jgi:hypothetical protein
MSGLGIVAGRVGVWCLPNLADAMSLVQRAATGGALQPLRLRPPQGGIDNRQTRNAKLIITL